VANVAFGWARLARPQPGTVRVAALVDATATATAWNGHPLAAAQTYAADIRLAAAQGARFVVTPEAGIVTPSAATASVLAPLAAISRQTGSQIIAGVEQTRPAGNLAFSILPDGTVRRYDKRHLVPILGKVFTPGHGSGWLGDARAVEICKDMDFPGTVRLDAARGVRLMGVPAEDFNQDAWLHARMAAMRGVEDGFALARAASKGLVMASDAQGRLLAAKMDTHPGLTMVVADLPLGPGPTLYARTGDIFAWLCTAFLLWTGAYLLFLKRPNAPEAATDRLRKIEVG
jgi:apolipoprotein N-acyltransferase